MGFPYINVMCYACYKIVLTYAMIIMLGSSAVQKLIQRIGLQWFKKIDLAPALWTVLNFKYASFKSCLEYFQFL